MKKKNKVQDVAIAVYTDEMIDICYPEYSKEERIHFSLIDDLEKVKYAQKKLGVKLRKIRRVVLDGEFLDWLENNNYKNNEENRSLYASIVSDEKAEELWIKNDMNIDVLPMLQPIVVFGGEHFIPANEITISNDMIVKINEFVANTLQVETKDVWVHSKLTRSDVWEEENEMVLFEYVNSHFRGGKDEYASPKRIVPQKDITVDMRFIPVGVRYRSKANTTLKELKNEMKSLFLDGAAERLSVWLTEEFKEQNLSFSVMPIPNTVDEALDVREEFMESLKQQAKLSKTKLIMR